MPAHARRGKAAAEAAALEPKKEEPTLEEEKVEAPNKKPTPAKTKRTARKKKGE